MTAQPDALATETIWPVVEAFLLAGLSDDPERLAAAIEGIEDLLADDHADGVVHRVNAWLVRFRYTFRLVRDDDDRLYAKSDGPPGRQLRWPITGQVVEVTPAHRPGVDGLVRLHLLEPDGCRLVVETSACETWEPGEWVTVTGQLAARIVDGAVVIRSPGPGAGPAPSSGRCT